jgi:DNA modification methylase
MTVGVSPPVPKTRANGHMNKLDVADRAVHDWYRFVLSFPPHLVRDYVAKFDLDSNATILDPFCGTGTTLVECKKLGIGSVGIEAHPMSAFASAVKTNWYVHPAKLLAHARRIADNYAARCRRKGFTDNLTGFTRPPTDCDLLSLAPELQSLLLTNSISPAPLHRALVLADAIGATESASFSGIERLALAHTLVSALSNLKFGPEVGLGEVREDAGAVAPWYQKISLMHADLAAVRDKSAVNTQVFCGDARQPSPYLLPQSIDAVITSPPYPNEKDYTRTTRLESVLLGLVTSKLQLRELKQGLIRSNTRNVYVNDQDDQWVATHPEIERIAREIEAKRISMGKTSGFERLYHRVARLYFGGMARHLSELRPFLKPGARLAYVVGDQASYLQVMIRTGQILGDIAESLGYHVDSIDLFRTRLATATKEQLREEVVVLRWPNK